MQLRRKIEEIKEEEEEKERGRVKGKVGDEEGGGRWEDSDEPVKERLLRRKVEENREEKEERKGRWM